MSDAGLADRVAGEAALRWELAAPVPMRRGMNALYASGEAIVRVGHATADPSLMHDLAVVMADHGVPTVEPLRGAVAVIEGVPVSGWHRLAATSDPVDWTAVGRSVRQVHRVPPDAIPDGFPVPLPTDFPWWQFGEMLAELGDDLDRVAYHALAAAVDRHRPALDRITDAAVICHGDVHPGNVVMTSDGPVLVDWDLLCWAPPGWDHAMLTTYETRWGGPPGTYEDFAAGYGQSFADDSFTRSIAELRNVAATLMRVRAGRDDAAAAAEAERRLAWWRGEAGAPIWRAQ